MGEKEVTARYLPSTQLAIQNAGGREQEGNKEQNCETKQRQTHPVLHLVPGKEGGQEAASLEQVLEEGGLWDQGQQVEAQAMQGRKG